MDVREVLNGIFYILSTGCQWRALRKDLPPRSTVHDYLQLWEWDGTPARIHHALFVEVRELAGTPEDVAAAPGSFTGQYLAKYLDRGKERAVAARRPERKQKIRKRA